VLVVTCGDVAADQLRAASIGTAPGDDVLVWRDILHDGPVPAALAPPDLARVRARFLTDVGWAGHDAALADLLDRDARLDRHLAAGDEVVLAFDANVVNQLQLLQVLDRIGDDVVAASVTTLVVEQFSAATSAGLRAAHAGRAPVTTRARSQAHAAWSALRSPTPEPLEAVRRELDALPATAAALTRLLEELPGAHDGLARSERQALAPLHADGGRAGLHRLMAAEVAAEDHPFLGDTALLDRLAAMSTGPTPLVAVDGDDHVLTDRGRAVLDGQGDRVDAVGIDRWLGGTHLVGDPDWRWDDAAGQVVVRAR
jgi:hypothetical protein